MLAGPLFREFREPNETMKLNGADIDYVATQIENFTVDKLIVINSSPNHHMQYFFATLLLVMHKLWLKSITS